MKRNNKINTDPIYYLNLVLKSILAGFLIAFAGTAYLLCKEKNLSDAICSLVFGIGLVSVIILQANLYTGKIAYVNSKQKLLDISIILIVNLLVAFVFGLLFRSIYGETNLIVMKTSKGIERFFIDSFFCGVCIYIAVEGYAITKSFIPVILGVFVFVICGWEHCIADMFYFGGGNVSLKGLLYILFCILGNSLGSLFARYLHKNIEIGIKNKEEKS